MEGVRRPVWDVKVTSKGQITIPKQARDAMMVREGDHLEAYLEDDDSIVLRRRDKPSDGERLRAYARRSLEDKGIDPDDPPPDLLPEAVRKQMPTLDIDLTERIRAQREGRAEP